MTDQVADTGVATWTVVIPLPIGADWISLNRLPRHAGQRIRHDALKATLRRRTFEALRDAGVPRDLGRISVQVELRFVDRRTRDVSNFELTLKPIIDALQPTTTYEVVKKKKFGGRTVRTVETVTAWGWGVIKGDDQRYLERPEPIIGEPIGRGTGRKGVVILHITALTDTKEDA